MSKAKLKEYKVRPDDLLDLIDAANVAESAAITKRCPGGRLIADGYMCIHCGQDPSAIYDEKGKELEGPRQPGKTYRRKCGEPAAKLIANKDLTKLFPTRIE